MKPDPFSPDPIPRRSLPQRLWRWLVSEPIADRYDRTARALADPTYDRNGCWCATGPHHHPACVLRRTR